MNDSIITKQMLTVIREAQINKKNIIQEEVAKSSDNTLVINKNTPQFSDIRQSQEEMLIKTIGENIEMGNDALYYDSNTKDLVLNGKVVALNTVFQFRYNDPSGDGCYIWANSLQLTESNLRTIGKIRDAFMNWKSNLLQNGDLFDKLDKASKNND